MRFSITNLMLMVVAIALLLLVLYEPGIDDAPVAPAKLFSLSASEVNEISIHNGGQPLIILKRESAMAWQMVEPITVAANGYKVASVLNILDEQPTNRFTVDAAKFTRYGLSKPQVRLRLKGAGGEQELNFGSQTPLNRYRYLQLDNEVVTIKDSAFYPVASLYTNFITSRLIPDGEQITSIQLSNFRLKFVDGVWKLESKKEGEALEDRLSADQLAAWIDGWRYARSVDIEAITRDVTESEKQEMVTITLKSGAELHWTIASKGDDGGLILERPDLGIEYHMSDAQRTALLLPPHSEPVEQEQEVNR